MGSLYSKTMQKQDAYKYIQSHHTFQSIKQQKLKLIEQMKKHLDEESCENQGREYLYRFPVKDLKNWIPVVKHCCAKADYLNNQFMMQHGISEHLKEKQRIEAERAKKEKEKQEGEETKTGGDNEKDKQKNRSRNTISNTNENKEEQRRERKRTRRETGSIVKVETQHETLDNNQIYLIAI